MTELVHLPAVDLQAFAQDTKDIFNVAKVLSETIFTPTAMRGDAAACCAAIMFGAGLGMDPMSSLRNIHVIEGQPSLSALALRGLVLGQGHEIELVEASETRVVMRGRRKGSERWQEVMWTMDRARKAGLDGRPNYKKHPQAMLTARASSELCRLVAPDVLLGCPYSAEELSEGTGVVYNIETGESTTVTAPAKPRNERRVMQRTPLAAAPEPELDPQDAKERDAERELAGADAVKHLNQPPPAEPETVPTVTPYRKTAPGPVQDVAIEEPAPPAPQPSPENRIQDNTRRAIMATFGEASIKDRNTRMARVVDIVGRHVDSVNQLTEPEARTVIDAIKNGPRALPSIPERSAPSTDKDSDYDWPELGGAS